MIQTIGIMIGVYILVRMCEIVDDKSKGLALKIFASICIVVTGIGLMSLFFTRSSPMTP